MKTQITRRTALTRMTTVTAAVAAAASLSERLRAADTAAGAAVKGRIHHSVCKWCYDKVPLEDLCKAGKKWGCSRLSFSL